MAEIFSEEGFLINDNWIPAKLYEIAKRIQEKERYNFNSKKFKPRMIIVLMEGSQEMERRLEGGIDKFYQEIEIINQSSGEIMWDFVLVFKKNIHNVGSALICDFLKNIGCNRFVKVDHHFKKEFPDLLGVDYCGNISEKKHFLLSQEISEILKISPFNLDHILYQWGRYKKYK